MADKNYIKQIELVQKDTSSLINIGSPNLVEITYMELKGIRDVGALEKGTWYRITDYASTFDNKFDIISLAVSSSTLSDECRAIRSASDVNYFSSSNLLSWRIWYNLDLNEVYRMIDEYGNDCPYDFKNVLINGYYTFNKISDGRNTDASLVGNAHDNIIKYNGDGINNIVIKCNTEVYNNTFGCDCHDIVLSEDSCNNHFGSKCYNIYLGPNSKNNTIGNDCYNIVIGGKSNVDGSPNTTNSGKGYTTGNCIRVDDTVSFVNIYNDSSSVSNPKSIDNVHVYSEVHGTETTPLDIAINSHEINTCVNVSVKNHKSGDIPELYCWYV